jgi:predicted Rossmann fold nucleotide-binding protein DprA/Smf involved in DNA uptake
LLTNPPPAGHVSATDTKPVRRPKRDLTSPERERILRLLSPVPTSIDELVSLSALPVDLVHLAILELQIAGRVSIEASGKITLLEA